MLGCHDIRSTDVCSWGIPLLGCCMRSSQIMRSCSCVDWSRLFSLATPVTPGEAVGLTIIDLDIGQPTAFLVSQLDGIDTQV